MRRAYAESTMYQEPVKRKKRILNIVYDEPPIDIEFYKKKHENRKELIKKLDYHFSQAVRKRDNWRCIKCGRRFPPPTQALHCSHFFKRGDESVRWDFENCDSLCYFCHRFAEINKSKGRWYYEFKLEQLGEERFEELRIRSITIVKYSILDLRIYIENMRSRI